MSRVVRSALAVLAVAMVPMLAPACGTPAKPGQAASASSSGSGGGGGAGGGGPSTYGSSACGMCVEQTACLTTLNTCASDPGCGAYLDCLDACPLGANGDADVACEKACPPVSGSAGKAAHEAFVNCRLSGPGANTCAPCGQIPAFTDPDLLQTCPSSTDPNACYKCEDEHCCDVYQACMNEPDCGALKLCIQACGDVPCEDKCYQDHPAGVVPYGHRIACLFHFCFDSDACGKTALTPCVKCQNLHCADETAACQHDLQCQLLDDCQVQCKAADEACFTACDTKFPTSLALHKSVLACGLEHCQLVCDGTMP